MREGNHIGPARTWVEWLSEEETNGSPVRQNHPPFQSRWRNTDFTAFACAVTLSAIFRPVLRGSRSVDAAGEPGRTRHTG